MSHNTHSTVGQIAGQCVVSRARAGAPATSHQSPVTGHWLPRRGISLTEVLIAMGILTVGLLGVAAIFPVAGFYMQKGEVADRGSAIAQAAFNEVITSGMLNPEVWQMGEHNSTGFVQYTKNFKSGLQDELVLRIADAPLRRQQIVNAKFGSAYVIDPLGVVNSPMDASDPLNLGQIRTTQAFPFNAAFSNYTQRSWWPWNWNAVNTVVPAYSPRWPLMRVTLPQVGPNTTTWPMSAATSDRLFRSSDDLGIDLPTQADRPSLQLMNKVSDSGTEVALSRQSRGEYSWLVTVVPPDANARDALAGDSDAHKYEVSVAVFYKRVIDNLLADTTNTERITRAKVASTGLSGGELLLEQIDSVSDPFGALKTGNWVVVCGPHPASTSELPRFVLRWYRILSIEGKDVRLNADGLTNPPAAPADPQRRRLTLRGPQWPWQPAPGGLSDSSHLSNNICVAIIPNVVAVHSKTIKLDGKSAWSVQ